MVAEMVANNEEKTTNEEPTPIDETIVDNSPKIDVTIRKRAIYYKNGQYRNR